MEISCYMKNYGIFNFFGGETVRLEETEVYHPLRGPTSDSVLGGIKC